jgi:hypothetical protein
MIARPENPAAGVKVRDGAQPAKFGSAAGGSTDQFAVPPGGVVLVVKSTGAPGQVVVFAELMLMSAT